MIKDSGERTEFDTGALRDMHAGKGDMVSLPNAAILRLSKHYEHGAEKYGEASYRKVDPKRYRAALMRHICKWLKDPYGVDEDSGLPHLWHIACNVAFLLELDKDSAEKALLKFVANLD